MLTFDLKHEHLKQVRAILKTHVPHAEVWAYGSRVNGDCHKASDLDLVIRDPSDLSRHCERLYELKEAFSQSDLPIIVDVIDWARIPVSFHAEIEKEHIDVQKGTRGR